MFDHNLFHISELELKYLLPNVIFQKIKFSQNIEADKLDRPVATRRGFKVHMRETQWFRNTFWGLHSGTLIISESKTTSNPF